MISALPVLIVIWAILTALFLALLAYNGTVTRYEENQLFLADINANEQQQQHTIVRKVNRTLPFIRALGSLSAIMTVAIIAIYTWDAWQKIQQSEVTPRRAGKRKKAQSWNARRSQSRPRETGSLLLIDCDLRVVHPGGDPASVPGPVGVGELAARLVHSLVGVCAEVVALRLKEVRRQTGCSISVVEAQRGGDSRRGYADLDGLHDRPAPAGLVFVQRAREKVVQQQVGERGVLVKRCLDVAEEARADDAAAAPHQRNAAHVQVPALVLLRGAQQHVALRVAHHLGAVERAAHLFDELFALCDGFRFGRPVQYLGRLHALVLQGGEAAGKHALADQRQRHAQVERRDGRPLACALLSGGVEDLVDQRRSVFVLLGEDGGGDFDEVAVQLALVPLGEDVVQFVGGEAERVLEQLVGFADELNVAVLDAVVDHLDVVTRAVLANPVATRGSVFDFGRDGLEDGLDVRPRRGIAAGHDGRAEARALLAAGDAGADEKNSLGRPILGSPVRIGEQRISAVDDDVALLQMGEKLVDGVVDHVAGLHHDHHPARRLEQPAQLLHGVRADHLRALGFILDEVVHLGDGAVEYRNLVAVIVHVENQILPHPRQANQANIATTLIHQASPDRMSSGRVSILQPYQYFTD